MRIKLPSSFIFFVSYFILFLPYRSLGVFTDEADNIVGGMVVANGGVIYVDFYSQHTPIMYMITAIYKTLGAQTNTEFRLLFFLTMSLIFVIYVNRYQKTLGVDLLCLFPILYITQLPFISSYAHMILSEHIQSLALLFLFTELLLFATKKQWSPASFLVVSLSSFFAIGVAFVSVFPVMILLAGFVWLGVTFNVKDNGWFKSTMLFIKASLPGLPILLAPFIFFGLYMLFTNSLDNFIEQAYTFNRDVYSKYNGSFGASISQSIYPTLNNQGLYFIESVNAIKDHPLHSIRSIVLMCFTVLLLSRFVKANKPLAFITFMFMTLVSPRGLHEFHSLPYWSASCLMLVLVLQYYKKHLINWNWFREGLMLSFLILVFLSPYLSQLSGLLPLKKEFREERFPPDTLQSYINTLLQPNDRLATTSVMGWYYVDTQKLPASRVTGMVPWFAEWYVDDLINDLIISKPKVIIHNPTYNVWGYILKDYAPTLIAYISENYTNDGMPAGDLWVRNDFHDEALNLLIQQSK